MSHILIVDDNELDGESIRRTINNIYHSIFVTQRKTAEAGFSFIQSPPRAVNLIIADYNLPGMNGLEFCKRLRKIGIHIPFILMTGNGSEEIAVEALRSGVSDYIVKSSEQTYRSQLIKSIPQLLKQWDVTRKDQQDLIELREKTAILEKENRTLSQFTQVVSHDLYTPLSQLAGFADLLIESSKEIPVERKTQYLSRIHTIAHESIETIDALLSRSNHPDQIDLECCHTQIILNSAITRLTSKIKDGQHQIVVRKQLPDTVGRADWIETIWINLLDYCMVRFPVSSRLEINYEFSAANIVRFSILQKTGAIGLTTDDFCRSTPTQSGIDSDPQVDELAVTLDVVHRILNVLGGSLTLEESADGMLGISFELKRPQKPITRLSAPKRKPLVMDLTPQKPSGFDIDSVAATPPSEQGRRFIGFPKHA